MSIKNSQSMQVEKEKTGNIFNISQLRKICPSLGLSLSPQSENGSLNVNELLALFEGSRENLNYFLGLWNATKLTTKKENDFMDEKNYPVVVCNCDPRDARKRQHIKDWAPDVIISSERFSGGVDGSAEEKLMESLSSPGLLDGVDDDDAVSESYATKQTVLNCEREDRADRFIHTKNDDDMEGLSEQDVMKRFPCGVHGCAQVSSSLASYESHYRHCHSYVCDVCRRLFVSNFLLDIHLQENHDSYFAVLSPRIDMYRCLVESCEQKFRTLELRRDHLVTVHKFPSSFSFHQPINACRSKHTQRSAASSVGPDNKMECENSGALLMGVESTKHSVGSQNISHRKKVPSSICFGRGSQRAFEQQRRGRGISSKNNNSSIGKRKGHNWFQQSVSVKGQNKLTEMESVADTTIDIESVDMKDLADAL